VTGSQIVDGQISFVLSQNRARLEAESYAQDEFIALLSEMARATWKDPELERGAFGVEEALASIPTRARPTTFLQLCVDFGFVQRNDVNTLRFRDAWPHGYLAARSLVHLLRGEHSDRGLTRDRAVDQLARIGSPAIPALIAALAAQDDAMCLGAAVALRGIGPSAAPALTEALLSGNQRVRRWATEALSSKDNANAALPVLLRVVREDDRPLVVAGAVLALGRSHNPEAEPGLITALRHDDSMVRMFSKQALEEFDSPRARRALDDLARSPPCGPSNAAGSRGPDPRDEDNRILHERAMNSPRIFISYAKEDVRYANELRRLLKLADFDPWMDSAGLLGGEAWEARLAQVIRTSDFVVALLSKHTAGGYQEEELRVAMNDAPAGRRADAPFVLPCALMRFLRGDTEQALRGLIDNNQLVNIWDFDANWRQVHERLYMSARAAGLSAPTLLRSKPRTDLTESAANRMIAQRNFFDGSRNREGRPAAAILNTCLNGGLVEDRATGRMWTRNCSSPKPLLGPTGAYMVARGANQDRLGDADDWRLPTLEEAMSVMAREKNAEGFFISPDFSDERYVLTCDTFVTGERSFVWAACYGLGDCQTVPSDTPVSVRLVRTDWEHLE
jgi:hypothetical protein